MTFNETVETMNYLKIAYPLMKIGDTEDEIRETVGFWQDMFQCFPKELVQSAIKIFVMENNSGFPPTIGQINQVITDIIGMKELSMEDAWVFVQKALKKSAYFSLEEFEVLPKEVQAVIQSPNKLKQWSAYTDEQITKVAKPEFKKGFEGYMRHAYLRKYTPELGLKEQRRLNDVTAEERRKQIPYQNFQ